MKDDTSEHAAKKDIQVVESVSSAQALLFASAVTVGAVVCIIVAWFGMIAVTSRLTPDPVGDAMREQAAAEAAIRQHLQRAGETVVPIDTQIALRGRLAFMTSCVTCHGEDAQGRPGLGKSLVLSTYVAQQSDSALTRMIAQGRAVDDPLNTTKVLMPPKGGNASLNDDDLIALVQYLRAVQDPRRMPALPKYEPPALVQSADEMSKLLAVAAGDKELEEYITHGLKLYSNSCVACHGQGGKGMPGNGKPLVTSEFIKSMDDEKLLAFIKRGRDPGDPLNTTGVGMPAKGGNPALSDDDLLDVIAYLRALQGSKPVEAK